MPHLRGTFLSLHDLQARLWAAPFTAGAAFRSCLTHLDPHLKGATEALWHHTEGELRKCFPSISLEELVAWRDRIWFRAGSGPRPLQVLLREMAHDLLLDDGNVLRPIEPSWAAGSPVRSPSPQGRSLWRWVSQWMPEDLLRASVGRTGLTPVDACTPALSQALRADGFAESHLHMGATLHLHELWVLRLLRLTDGSAVVEAEEDAWALRAALARRLIAVVLTDPAQRPASEVVDEQLGLHRRWDGPLAALAVERALDDLECGTLSATSPAQLRAILRRTCPRRASRPPDSIAGLHTLDPVADLLRAGSVTPEMQWLSRGLARLDRGEARLARWFWQVIRRRENLVRAGRLSPRTAGLTWFNRSYLGMSRVRGHVLEPLLLDGAVAGAGPGLRSLEVRTTPGTDVHVLRKLVSAVATWGMEGADRPRVALVLHWQRPRWRGEGTRSANSPAAGTQGDPTAKGNCGWRYRGWYANARKEALAVARLLRSYPDALRTLRALDACNDEAVPMWVLAPLLRHVRDVSREVSHELQARDGACVPPLSLTVHAGESFIHLWSGMRAVGEALHHLPLVEHDRLGHALALGVDPVAWSRGRGTVAMPREDRMVDLVWMRDRLVACGAQAEGYRIEDELRTHAHAMFGMEIRVEDLRAAVARLYDPACLRRLAWHSGAVRFDKPHDPVDELVLQYLTDVGTFERGQEVVLVHTALDVPMMCATQELLRSEVRARGVTVEVNPSSNLLVGDLGDLTRHPVFQLSPLRADAPRVAVTLGSDDPSIFNSPLRVEWQLLKDAAALHPDALKDVDQWLERIRVHGLRCSFALSEVRPVLAGGALPPSRIGLPP